MLPDHPRVMRRRASGVARKAFGLLLSGSLLVVAGAAFAQPSAEEKAAARALALQGADALKNNKFSEALDLVTRAESLFHAPPHLLMIAKAQIGLGKLVAAQETLLKLTREELRPDAPGAFKSAQAAGREELAAIEPKIASLKIIVDGAVQKKATVKLDDVVVPSALLGVFRPVDPGPHQIAVIVPGANPVNGSVDLKDGEKKDIKIALPDVPANAADNPEAGKPGSANTTPIEPPHDGPGFFTPLRGAGLGVGVVGIAGVAVGAFFIAKGSSSQTQADDLAKGLGCKPPTYVSCPGLSTAQQTQLNSADKTAANQKTIGAIAVPVGVAALGAGVALMVIGKPKPSAAAAASPSHAYVTPFFSGTGGGLRGEF